MKHVFKFKLMPLLLIVLAPVCWIVGVDAYVKSKASPYIYQTQDAPSADVIVVLGARVYPNGSVSTILADRLQAALELKNAGKSDRFLVSGDHGQIDYDEVNAMRSFWRNGMCSLKIFLWTMPASALMRVCIVRVIFSRHTRC